MRKTHCTNGIKRNQPHFINSCFCPDTFSLITFTPHLCNTCTRNVQNVKMVSFTKQNKTTVVPPSSIWKMRRKKKERRWYRLLATCMQKQDFCGFFHSILQSCISAVHLMCYGVLLRLSIIIQFTASKLQKSRLHVLLSTNTMNNISTGGCKQNVIKKKKKEKKGKTTLGSLFLWSVQDLTDTKHCQTFLLLVFFSKRCQNTNTESTEPVTITEILNLPFTVSDYD